MTAEPRAPDLGQWLYGCDLCQEACPFNRRPWPGGEDFPGASELAAMGSPEDMVRMSYEVVGRELFRRFRSIPEDRLWKWKINALNALRNDCNPATGP